MTNSSPDTPVPRTEPSSDAPGAADGFPLTVIVLAKNEAANLPRCLESVAWCARRVVADDHSSDGSAEVARECGAEVLQRRFDSFAGQRNAAIEACTKPGDWVLLLDADEVCTAELRAEIERTLPSASSETVGYRMCRKTMLHGRWLKRSDGFPVWIMRLVRSGQAAFADRGHGEVPVPKVDGELGTLREPFLHFAFSRGIGDWVTRHVRYADREARLELADESDRPPLRLRSLLSRDRSRRREAQRTLSRRMPGRPLLRFAYQYVLKLGFLDGSAGLTFALLMAGYEGLIVLRRRELRDAGEPHDAAAGPASQ